MSTRPRALALCLAGLFLLSGCLGGGGFGGETATPSAEALGAQSGVPDYPDDPENVSIRYESHICGGSCSAFVVELCGNGTVYFAGFKDVNVTGIHRYEIPQRNVTAVLNASYRTEFFAKDEKIGGDGEAHVEQLTVRIGNRSKTVSYVHPCRQIRSRPLRAEVDHVESNERPTAHRRQPRQRVRKRRQRAVRTDTVLFVTGAQLRNSRRSARSCSAERT